jgi:hypothetical protein
MLYILGFSTGAMNGDDTELIESTECTKWRGKAAAPYIWVVYCSLNVVSIINSINN